MTGTAPRPTEFAFDASTAAEDEAALRRRLGIPADARRVLVFGESSHWDPNWLHTSEGYYEKRIRPIMDQVMEQLASQPRRVFSVESVFFLRMLWERRPELRARLRELLNERRLRLTGCGITTPDTVLPDTESILRDYLLGQEWLRARGVQVEPRLAYLPDSFGHSPALPALLSSLGMDMAAVTRIDGMHFVAADYRPRAAFPLPGSSAERLQRELGTADFVWRAPDGSEILCHWNAFSYFQGDLLGHRAVVRWMDVLAGIPWRTARHVARQIEGYVAQLAPLALTPYLFCPIGCDFVGPIPDLIALLDRYNERRYTATGVFAVNAGLDDYLQLVSFHRSRLPVVAMDPNPYWMGFYGSRPGLKSACRRVVRDLSRAEKLALSNPLLPDRHAEACRAAWDRVVVANHHDYITGTSPDTTVAMEQQPWLREAQALAHEALQLAVPAGVSAPRSRAGETPAWRRVDGGLEVETEHARLLFSEAAGGCLVSLEVNGVERLAGPANDVVAYHDAGGLWRLGHEFRGGHFRRVAAASENSAVLRVRQLDALLEVSSEVELGGRRLTRWMWIRGDEPALRMRLRGAAAHRLTLTCRFPARLRARQLTMDVPGGIVERPAQKLFTPTFWPARSFAHVLDPETDAGVAVFMGGPAAISLEADGGGAVEIMALRNAPHERAFGVLPIACHPIGGSDPEPHDLDYGVCFTRSGGVLENRLPSLARRILADEWLRPGQPDMGALADALISCQPSDVLVGAVKPASRGAGIIVRLESFTRHPQLVRLRAARPIQAAALCDARERDLRPLPVSAGTVALATAGAITSVRLLLTL